MRKTKMIILMIAAVLFSAACTQQKQGTSDKSAAEILGNPETLAMSYGGYRQESRDLGPTVDELKEDMLLLSAMGIRIIRTYNASHFPQAENILKAIRELKNADPTFEMYVMIGAWIDCDGAWTDTINHEGEDVERNTIEIATAVALANRYPDIVKIIGVGNEAMVHWAGSYFVRPGVILKWVDYLQQLKKEGSLPAATWITSSDNFAAWGGGDASYHVEDLTALIKAVDYISMHSYPFHDTHYNPAYWTVSEEEKDLPDLKKIDAAMLRAKDVAISQYDAVSAYMKSLGIDKPIHIGETGWATIDNSMFTPEGSGAADEYKQKLYYEHMREWTREAGMSCFFFEAFDEKWKDDKEPLGSENHFGLINLQGEAKYALWKLVDEGVFVGLTRNGQTITKTFGGDEDLLLSNIVPPPVSTQGN